MTFIRALKVSFVFALALAGAHVRGEDVKPIACGVEFSIPETWSIVRETKRSSSVCAATVFDRRGAQGVAPDSDLGIEGFVIAQWNLTPEQAANKILINRRDWKAGAVDDGSFISEDQAKDWATAATAKSSGTGVSFIEGENWVGYCANDVAGLPGGGAGDYVRAILYSEGHAPITIEGPGSCDLLFGVIRDLVFVDSSE